MLMKLNEIKNAIMVAFKHIPSQRFHGKDYWRTALLKILRTFSKGRLYARTLYDCSKKQLDSLA
jgi:hypothetical protein